MFPAKNKIYLMVNYGICFAGIDMKTRIQIIFTRRSWSE